MAFCIPRLKWAVNCYLSVISNRSRHPLLTSDINKAFFPVKCWSVQIFPFYFWISVNPRDRRSSQQISSFWCTQTSPSATNRQLCSKSLQSHFFLILMLGLNLRKLLLFIIIIILIIINVIRWIELLSCDWQIRYLPQWYLRTCIYGCLSYRMGLMWRCSRAWT